MPDVLNPGKSRPLRLTVGPFIGCRDAVNLSSQDAERGESLINVYTPLPEVGVGLWSRPGFKRVGVARTLTGVVVWGAQASGYALTGTITATNGSTAVTGVGTAFTTQLVPGAAIYNATLGGPGAIVLSIASDTALTLAGAWGGTTGSRSDWKGGANGAQALVLATALSDTIQVGDVVNLNGTGALVTNRTSGTSWTVAGAPAANYQGTTTAYGGGVVDGPILHVCHATDSAGAEHRLIFAKTTNTEIAGGAATKYRFLDTAVRIRLIEYDPSSATLPFTDRTSSSMDAVALSSTSRIYSVNFANSLIISDGVNRPRKINTATWVLSDLTNYSTASYGPPVVYYGKLFFVDAATRSTLYWSDENDPDNGYTATGYNNSWTLRQTGSSKISALAATNDALYVFRENSITAITGAVNDDFRSAGTLDAISNTTGTRSPDSVCLVESSVWFLDTYGRPHKIEAGRGLVPLYAGCFTAVRDVGASTTNIGLAWGRYIPELQIVVFGYRDDSSATGVERLLVFSARTEEYLGSWSVSGTTDLAYGAIIKATDGRPVLGIGHGGTSEVALYVQKQEGSTGVALDTLAASTPTPAVTVRTGRILGSPDTKKVISRVLAETQRIGDDQPILKCAYRAQDSATFSTPVTMDQATVADGQPAVARIGIDKRNARYIQIEITNDTTDTARVAIDTITVLGDEVGVDNAVA